MDFFDVFNGDADGLCALHQLRLDAPRDATLVTGVKRDIELLRHVPLVPGAHVTVLDVSMARNRAALLDLLACGMVVQYFDHHMAGDIPRHAQLQAHITSDAAVCTSMLVDRHLGGRYRAWAVVGAFGDNLGDAARQMAAGLDLQPTQIAALQDLGECLNYNAYGDTEADLFMRPADLYQHMRPYADPWHFLAEAPVVATIRAGRDRDLTQAWQTPVHAQWPGGRIFVLPDAAWSRRVRGAWGNLLAQQSPAQAHALVAPGGNGAYVVSVRAPLHRLRGAEHLCAAFPGGGGRAAAAGIDHLAPERLAEFVSAFGRMYGEPAVD